MKDFRVYVDSSWSSARSGDLNEYKHGEAGEVAISIESCPPKGEGGLELPSPEKI